MGYRKKWAKQAIKQSSNYFGWAAVGKINIRSIRIILIIDKEWIHKDWIGKILIVFERLGLFLKRIGLEKIWQERNGKM